MNTKRNYYLLVPADSIYNKVTSDDGIAINNQIANETFERYHIPAKFRKMIIKITVGGITEPNDAFELITSKMFYFKTPFLKALFNPIGNSAIEILSKDVGIVTENRIHSADVVKDFYQSIIDNDLALGYECAIREILNLQKEQTHKGLFTRIKKRNN